VGCRGIPYTIDTACKKEHRPLCKVVSSNIKINRNTFSRSRNGVYAETDGRTKGLSQAIRGYARTPEKVKRTKEKWNHNKKRMKKFRKSKEM
jgi:hypothetical protein